MWRTVQSNIDLDWSIVTAENTFFTACVLDRSNLFTLLMKSSSSEMGLRRSETSNIIGCNKFTLCQWTTNNDQYQMIIKWSHACTLKPFSHFLILGFLSFLGIQWSTWCSHNTKTSCLKALEKCWNSFYVSRYALISGHPGGGGGDPGVPPVICTTAFANPPYR